MEKFYVITDAEVGYNFEQPAAVFLDKEEAIAAGIEYGCDAVYEVINFQKAIRIPLIEMRRDAAKKAREKARREKANAVKAAAAKKAAKAAKAAAAA